MLAWLFKSSFPCLLDTGGTCCYLHNEITQRAMAFRSVAVGLCQCLNLSPQSSVLLIPSTPSQHHQKKETTHTNHLLMPLFLPPVLGMASASFAASLAWRSRITFRHCSNSISERTGRLTRSGRGSNS